jgi:hypothetical protein
MAALATTRRPTKPTLAVRRCTRAALAGLLLAAACQSPGTELSGLAQLPPLDYAVLVTGGAFLKRAPGGAGTFVPPAAPGDAALAVVDDEPLHIDAVLDVLQRGAVFRRVAADPDLEHRRAVIDQLGDRNADRDLLGFLESARDRGFDLLLVLEQVQDGPIDAHGINGRWPVTLATWLLLGVGMFIPDHTFESSATLRVTVRDLQTGRKVHDWLIPAGPVDLSLVERGSTWGLLLSIIVPPFWVQDDVDNVARGVLEVTERRLLLSLAREVKSEPTRQRLREQAVAAIGLAAPRHLTIEAKESVTAVRLRPAAGPVDDDVARRFEAAVLATLRRDGGRFRYEADVPAEVAGGALQVLVATITGSVSSATFELQPQSPP